MNRETLIEKADEFIQLFYTESGLSDEACQKRKTEIKNSIMDNGIYTHTLEELTFGARAAWRNSNRCIGRLFWNSLEVIDARDAASKEEVKEMLLKHIEFATNNGKIRSTVTVFSPRGQGRDPVRILNHQLIRYAGYSQQGGTVVGDPHSIQFTEFCESIGWKGEGTHFDVLPIVVQLNEEEPFYFDIPSSMVKEVKITHPEITGIEELGLKWYAVPIISEMKLEIGGIEYIAAPFNGWYMETEIGARNFADDYRYNQLPAVAEKMGLSNQYQSSLWKDRALIELNQAVLYSYKKAGVSITDHHTAGSQFALFEEREKQAGREVTGDWTWLIPPVSPASSHIFHKRYKNKWNSPNFFYQPSFYKSDLAKKESGCPFLSRK
ncbi:nitric oxide synthase oxygenase [Jeotgalibacillus proteolyticus]|uniref:Nitric oxide synthase oxygenase n=1 Tax=Jeotgalibacillus proteolyticus TaxID=2082395 RepID=A0A2S5G7B1_9BACL|nr:nitric oxide synthase oxygenase [Jeotgalibacillus proteolyticus]PPA68869.1 nitric oxide synthase [Jeotgalibacillus proteolyticus]